MNEPTYIYSSHVSSFRIDDHRWSSNVQNWIDEILSNAGVEYVNHTHQASQTGAMQYIVLITRSMTPGSPYSKER